MEKEYVTMSENNKENMRFMYPHFQNLFRNHQPMEFDVLEQNTMWHIDYLITWDEFNLSINGIRNAKATGFNSVTPKVFKSMNKDRRRYVFDFINEFWNNRFDFEIWHKSLLASVLEHIDFYAKFRSQICYSKIH